jgi:hypothetical protein
MLYLDHVIWTGNNVEQVSEKYGSDFAVKSIKGGEHDNWGTYNYLTHFSNNCYMEWLGIKDIAIAKKLDHPLIQHLLYALETESRGPFQFALRTDKLDEYIAHFTENNIPYTGPFSGQRKKPDGTLLSWRMLFPNFDFTNKELLPFLIEWDQPENVRVEASLINHQTITGVHFGGMTKERFTNIYNLPTQKLRNNNRVQLRNVKIHFYEESKLSIDLA